MHRLRMDRRAFVLALASVGAAAGLSPDPPADAAGPAADPPADPPRPPGAVGDGVADDTQAMQDLIDASAASGTAGVVPPGTYRCTRSLLLPSGAALHLERGDRKSVV